MDNEIIQTHKNEKDQNKRKSIIRKGIQRTLKTADYESIVISDEIQEEIEWSNLEERQRKVNNWETVLVENFKQTHDKVLEELNLSHKKAYFKSAPDKRISADQNSKLFSNEDLDTLE